MTFCLDWNWFVRVMRSGVMGKFKSSAGAVGISLRLDHCWPCRVLRGLLLQAGVLPGPTVEGIAWTGTVTVTGVCRVGQDTWGQVHRWADVVTRSWETHVMGEQWAWPRRPTDTVWWRHRSIVVRRRGTEMWWWWTTGVADMAGAEPGVERVSVGGSRPKLSPHRSRQRHTRVSVSR